jgi:NAD(P)-dependent dehydrogenase (short-subunit alcohol dehydrogenase family)
MNEASAPRTVLITGAGGNIGAKLRAHFTALGWRLRLLDVDARGDATIHAADLAEWDDAWVAQFEGADTVVHLAGNPSPRASWASAQRLNIDLTQNVYEAAVRSGVRRLVFASSNWVMAGYRPTEGVLDTVSPPYPINPYGVSKLMGERLGRSYHERWGLEVVCLRIGYCQRGANLPGPAMGMGRWGQLMWLSDRDLCHGMERAVVAQGIGYAVLNLMSDNPGMRWDIAETRRAIGYVPRDGATPMIAQGQAETEVTVHAARSLIERLDTLIHERRW